MSTSTKVTFDVATLETEVMAYHVRRVEAAQQRVDAITDDAALSREVEEWRRTTTKRVLEFARRLRKGEVTDTELDKFKVGNLPTRDHYGRQDARRDLANAKAAEDRARLKFNSLKRNDDGTISLTAAQLRDYFGVA